VRLFEESVINILIEKGLVFAAFFYLYVFKFADGNKKREQIGLCQMFPFNLNIK